MRFGVKPNQAALTLLDLAVVAAIVAVVAALVLNSLARPRRHGPHIRCHNHLKQVTQAARIFANDHEDLFPWQTADVSGGSSNHAFSPQVFRHFLVMSNELNTPKVLACPGDLSRSVATNFSSLANTNLGFFAGIEAADADPNALLFGDRYITGGTLSNGFLRTIPPGATVGWTTNVHQGNGNIALADGSAQRTTPASLQKHVRENIVRTARLAIP